MLPIARLHCAVLPTNAVLCILPIQVTHQQFQIRPFPELNLILILQIKQVINYYHAWDWLKRYYIQFPERVMLNATEIYLLGLQTDSYGDKLARKASPWTQNLWLGIHHQHCKHNQTNNHLMDSNNILVTCSIPKCDHTDTSLHMLRTWSYLWVSTCTDSLIWLFTIQYLLLTVPKALELTLEHMKFQIWLHWHHLKI